MTTSNEDPQANPAHHWDQRYQEKPAIWSGNPNAVLMEIAGTLKRGTALDLGCGEGADAIWLAKQGWQVRGVDISNVAIGRAQAAAESAGLDTSTIRFEQVDLAAGDAFGNHERFDLVTASFLHSTVELPRIEILKRASQLVAEGGHLLITSHAAPPPWAKKHFEESEHEGGHNHSFQTPREELEALDLPPASWNTVVAETRSRTATSPDGEQATLDDGVILLQRV